MQGMGPTRLANGPARLHATSGPSNIMRILSLESWPPCSAWTKSGEPCRVPADRFHQGRPVCHLHDPEGRHHRKLQAARWRRGQLALFSEAPA